MYRSFLALGLLIFAGFQKAPPPAEDRLGNAPVIAGIRFVRIPAGDVLIGGRAADPDVTKPELPSHRSHTKGFLMGRTEVTVRQFARFIKEIGYITFSEKDDSDYNWRSDLLLMELETPVRWVAWQDAVKFCEWMGESENVVCRLPTEREWEYACRAGSESIYPFGNDADKLDRFAFLPRPGQTSWIPAPVNFKPPNRFGLHGMLGNVSEWCLDGFGPYRSEVTPADTKGKGRGASKVLRGGNFGFGGRDKVRPSSRDWRLGSLYDRHTGFRVLIEIDENGKPRPYRSRDNKQ